MNIVEQKRHMSIVSLVKNYISDYQEKNGTLTAAEYEELFVKAYAYFMEAQGLLNPPKINHKKNGLH